MQTKGIMEILQLNFCRDISNPGIRKWKFIPECFSYQIGLSNSSPTVYGNKLGPSRIKCLLKNANFWFSPNHGGLFFAKVSKMSYITRRNRCCFLRFRLLMRFYCDVSIPNYTPSKDGIGNLLPIFRCLMEVPQNTSAFVGLAIASISSAISSEVSLM